MIKMNISIDTEKDLHSNTYKSLTAGLKEAEDLFDKYRIKPTLFATCDCIEKYPEIFKRLHKKGWEISLHGYRHERYDTLSIYEKEELIKKSFAIFNKIGIKPSGFRAPQHSIDNATLDILNKYNFKYDSSFTPLNLLQLIFFPDKIKTWINTTFARTIPHKIRSNLIEIPTSAFILPLVSMMIRFLPLFCMKVLVKLVELTNNKMILIYTHSWDFIELPESLTNRVCNKKKFLIKLSIFLEWASKSYKFIKLEDYKI